ncbi:hypothetical protein CA850_19800 [Micromonospora echinospora]|nr:hypothetical protein CA850_19800 [Micromonospora echinospora]
MPPQPGRLHEDRRDSNDPNGPALAFRTGTWSAFVRGLPQRGWQPHSGIDVHLSTRKITRIDLCQSIGLPGRGGTGSAGTSYGRQSACRQRVASVPSRRPWCWAAPWPRRPPTRTSPSIAPARTSAPAGTRSPPTAASTR